MDIEILARLQFAITIAFHYIYPPLSIGLAVVMVMVESAYMWTRSEFYRRMSKFWTRIFALTFSLGVATGIVMEFEFGTNWAKYSSFVGDVFGSALGAEGIFAFFLESGFLAILLFGWGRVRDSVHYFSTWMVCLGAHFSALWIVVANSWMQTPAGFKLVQGEFGLRAEITDFWLMMFNPSSMYRWAHVLIGCWLAGAFLVLSICAWYRLQNRHIKFARTSSRFALWLILGALCAALFTGHESAQIVAEYQPTKLAAMEGIFQTQAEAPLTLIGHVDVEKEQTTAVKIPGLLSWLLKGDRKAEVRGLLDFDRELWPPVQVTFQAYHVMTALWCLMLIALIVSTVFWRTTSTKHSLWLQKLMGYFLVVSVSFPLIANQAGWIVAEVGRQPWLVWGVLKTKDGLSDYVYREDIIFSLLLFTTIYALLFVLFIFLLDRKIRQGPDLGEDGQEGIDEYRNPYTTS